MTNEEASSVNFPPTLPPNFNLHRRCTTMNEAIYIPIHHTGTSAKIISTRQHYQPCTGKSHYYSSHSHQQPRPLFPGRHKQPVVYVIPGAPIPGCRTYLNTRYSMLNLLLIKSGNYLTSLLRLEQHAKITNANNQPRPKQPKMAAPTKPPGPPNPKPPQERQIQRPRRHNRVWRGGGIRSRRRL
jgi:hypothetical protein